MWIISFIPFLLKQLCNLDSFSFFLSEEFSSATALLQLILEN